MAVPDENLMLLHCKIWGEESCARMFLIFIYTHECWIVITFFHIYTRINIQFENFNSSINNFVGDTKIGKFLLFYPFFLKCHNMMLQMKF